MILRSCSEMRGMRERSTLEVIACRAHHARSTRRQSERQVAPDERSRRSRMIPRQLISGVLGLSLLGLAAAGCGTATGAAVGAGSGAAIGAGTGYGAGKGALIGVGVGAAAGAIYDITRHNRLDRSHGGP